MDWWRWAWVSSENRNILTWSCDLVPNSTGFHLLPLFIATKKVSSTYLSKICKEQHKSIFFYLIDLHSSASLRSVTTLPARMERIRLSEQAATICNQIREMIPETATLPNQPGKDQAELMHEDENGNKIYGGKLLTERAARLKEHMKIDQVSARFISQYFTNGIQDWTERLVYWTKPTKLLNQRKQGYIIPLSKDIVLQPGGPLEANNGFRVTNERILSSGAALFIMPQ